MEDVSLGPVMGPDVLQDSRAAWARRRGTNWSQLGPNRGRQTSKLPNRAPDAETAADITR